MLCLPEKLSSRARQEAGFGMIELLCAMGVMSIGILAVFAMFQSGTVQIRRASTVSTAAALADSEMEQFRAIKFSAIGLLDANGDLVVDGSDATYRGDGAYRAVSSPANQVNSAATIASTTLVPTRNVVGADSKQYRLDTYITWQTVQSQTGTSGRPVKRVTLVVRDPATLRVHARVSSTFDESTGL